jgi:hypothetical protein
VENMIVYFEDGSITNSAIFDENDNELIKVDAGMGYSHCRRKLRYIKDNYPFDTEVYTNSLDAFSNFWCWDDEKKMPMIYIRDEYGQWKLIREMTDKELRIAHNLEKLYVNGAFCNVEQ